MERRAIKSNNRKEHSRGNLLLVKDRGDREEGKSQGTAKERGDGEEWVIGAKNGTSFSKFDRGGGGGRTAGARL